MGGAGGGERWDKGETEEYFKGYLREAPLFLCEGSLAFIPLQQRHWPVIVIKYAPHLFQLHPGRILERQAKEINKQTNLRGHLLFLLFCLSIKIVYNGDITLPVLLSYTPSVSISPPT